MKLCTRIINVKKEYESAIVPDEWVFLENCFAVTHLNIGVTNFSESFIYCNKKTLFTRNYILFEMDFLSFSSI